MKRKSESDHVENAKRLCQDRGAEYQEFQAYFLNKDTAWINGPQSSIGARCEHVSSEGQGHCQGTGFLQVRIAAAGGPLEGQGRGARPARQPPRPPPGRVSGN
jgi:hypothetical protein